MNTSYQEHLDHVAGVDSELRNAFSESRDHLGHLDQSAFIDRASALGLFVVVHESPYYCRATDAFSGVVSRFVVAVATRDRADQIVRRLGPVDEDGYGHSVVPPQID